MIKLVILGSAFLLLLAMLAAAAFLVLFHQEITAIRKARRMRSHNGEWVCLRCTDCCCKTVILSRRDRQRLQEFTGSPAIVFSSRLAWLRILRKTADGHCIFHRHDTDASCCTVYPARPEACRKFPYLRYFGRPAIDPRCMAVKRLTDRK